MAAAQQPRKDPLFGHQDLCYLQDTEFLTAKLRIQEALRRLLEECQHIIYHHKTSIGLPDFAWQVPPKISRGENYEGLPYLVLDYPRIFKAETTFAYRCMFWWGHGFSCTLHLAGAYWQQYQALILQNLPQLYSRSDYWICVHDSPWEYHYRPENYLPLQDCLQQETLHNLATKPFFKISRRLPVEQYQELPHFCKECLQQLSLLLN